jgi:hypothetical protein
MDSEHVVTATTIDQIPQGLQQVVVSEKVEGTKQQAPTRATGSTPTQIPVMESSDPNA